MGHVGRSGDSLRYRDGPRDAEGHGLAAGPEEPAVLHLSVGRRRDEGVHTGGGEGFNADNELPPQTQLH